MDFSSAHTHLFSATKYLPPKTVASPLFRDSTIVAMSSGWPRNREPPGPSKLSIMQRAESSRSSSPEEKVRPSQQAHNTSHSPAPTQSNTAAANTEEFASALDDRQQGSGDQTGGDAGRDQGGGDTDYEAGDNSRGLRKDCNGGLLLMSMTEPQRTPQGSQPSPDNIFIDDDGDVDLNAIQEDDIRELGVEPVPERNTERGVVDPGDRQIGSDAPTAKRRKELEKGEDDQEGRTSKRPRIRVG